MSDADRPMAKRVVVVKPVPLTEEQVRIASLPSPYEADVDWTEYPFLVLQ